MKNISITDSMIAGAVSIERRSDQDGEIIQIWRIPYQRQEYYYPLIGLGACGAGVRIQVHTNSARLILAFVAQDTHRPIDLCSGNQLIHSQISQPGSTSVEFDLSLIPSDANQSRAVEIWLCQHTAMQLRHLQIDDNATCSAQSDKRVQWLTYGSSITQCSAAHSPARTWPATAARQLNLNLTCLGFSGNCMLETSTARMISKQKADLITLKLGINVMGQGSLNKRTYQPAVIGLLELIREEHPHTPIGVITSIYSTNREDTPNIAGMSLKDYRFETEEAVRRVRLYQNERIDIFDGLSVFGADLVSYLPDHLHPNGDGYEILGQRIAEQVLAPMIAKYTL